MKAFVLGSVLLMAAVCSGSYVPADTPEVAAAKAAHFAAHAHVAAHGGSAGHHWDHHDGPVQKWHGPIHIPVIHKGVPVDTPEVQHAKAFHAAAYAKVSSGYGHHEPASYDHAPEHHGAGAWHGPQHIPVIHNGVPVETPEVQHAKAFHLNALHNAGAHSGPAQWAAHGHGHEDDGSYKPHLYESEQY